MTVDAKLHVDGVVEGRINSTDEVSIGLNGEVHGDIVADRVYIGGRMQGTVTAESVNIDARGRLEGKVLCSDFIIMSGGQFVGECLRKEPTKSAVESNMLMTEAMAKQ